MLVQVVLILRMHRSLEELEETAVRSVVVAGSGQQVKKWLEVLPSSAFPCEYPTPFDCHQLNRQADHITFPGLEILLPPVHLCHIFLLRYALKQPQCVPLDLLAAFLPLQLPPNHYQDLL